MIGSHLQMSYENYSPTEHIWNEDCIAGCKKYLGDECIDLIICDPPFGISETSFSKHYYRNDNAVITDGYQEAPSDYGKFSLDWIGQCKRVLKSNGSLYIISGWNNLHHILNAIAALDLHMRNHIIWKYNFGVSTKKKFVTSHYHILYILKDKQATPVFNTYCRFAFNENDDDGGSLLYEDLEDVWTINKEYQHSRDGKKKNVNKLPQELIRKIIQYSSNEGDLVSDFFLGNFTTAIVAKKMGRKFTGFEINKNLFDYFVGEYNDLEFGSDLDVIKKVTPNFPKNQGKPLLSQEITTIQDRFHLLIQQGLTKKASLIQLETEFGRGRWSLERILKR